MNKKYLTKRLISHVEAEKIVARLISGAFNNNDNRPHFSIPADPNKDDDLLILAYINQQKEKEEKEEKDDYWSLGSGKR